MKKEKDEILVNYEGEPFYNCSTGEWYIDFEQKIKDELMYMIKDGEKGRAASSIVAVRNMTYPALLGLKKAGERDIDYFTFQLHLNDESELLPYCKRDIEYLFYRLGQLMTKHDNIPADQKSKIVYCTVKFMKFGGIDLIEEMGDVFNYPASTIEDKWERFLNSGETSYFKICKIFKTEFMRKRTFNTLRWLRWLDDCIG